MGRNSSTETATQPIVRQSCDRCHDQKLRCTRSETITGACNRCLRQGAQCVYSFSLPKGRPSRYRSTEAAAASLQANSNSNSSPESNRGHSNSPQTCNDGTAAASAGGRSAGITATPIAESADVYKSLSMSSTAVDWPWLNLGRGDIQTGRNHHDTSVYPPIDPQLHPSGAMSGSQLNWDFPSGPGGESDSDLLTSSGSSIGSSLGSTFMPSSTPQDTHAPTDSIAQLSQLSMRLHPLLSSSCLLAEATGASPLRDGSGGPMLNDITFKPVATWLAHVSANKPQERTSERQNPPAGIEAPPRLGDVIHNAFAASHQLLEILNCLQRDRVHVETTPWTSFTPPQRQSTPRTDRASQSGGGGARGAPSQYSSIVARHLITGCHGLLLSIYVVVLIALQLDTDLLLGTNQGGTPDIVSGGDNGTAPLADIRIVSVVHLCSYLVERQRHAVKQYLASLNGASSARPSPQHLYQQDPLDSSTPAGFGPGLASSPSALSHCGQEIMSDLEMEVHQRLSRLRQALRI